MGSYLHRIDLVELQHQMKSFAFSAFPSPAPAEFYKTVFLSMLELSIGARLWEQGLLKMLKTCLIYVKIKLPDFCVCSEVLEVPD